MRTAAGSRRYASRLAAALLAMFVANPPIVCAETSRQAASDAALLAFLRHRLSPQDSPLEDRALTATKLRSGWKDLNGDGRPEALVYISGQDLCGSGGCDMLVLEQSGGTFRVRGDLSISRLPVAVLPQRNHGWRSLTVLVAGGGIVPGYRAVLPFDGRHYPSNPSVEPAHPLKGNLDEEIIIGDDIYPFLGGPPKAGARR